MKSKEIDLENAARDILNHSHQRIVAETRLAAINSEMQDREYLILTKINSECIAFDEDIGPEADVDTALETLSYCLQFARAQASLNEEQEMNPEYNSRSPTPPLGVPEYQDAAIQTLSPIKGLEVSDRTTQTSSLSQPRDFDFLDDSSQTLSLPQRGWFDHSNLIATIPSSFLVEDVEVLHTANQAPKTSPVGNIETLEFATQASEKSPAGDTEVINISAETSELSSAGDTDVPDRETQTSKTSPSRDTEVLDTETQTSTLSLVGGDELHDSQDRDGAVQTSASSPSKSLDADESQVKNRSQVGRLDSIQSSPIKPKRKANRHSITRTKSNSEPSPRREVLIQESQVEETTIRRSVKRTTSSRGGGDSHRSTTSTPSRILRESSFPISTFSNFHQDESQELGPMSPMADMTGFFPPTPQQFSSASLNFPQGSKNDLVHDSTQESADLIQDELDQVYNTSGPRLYRSRRNSRSDYQSQTEQVEESYNSSSVTRKDRVNKFAAMADAQTGSSRATVVPKGILKDSKGIKRNGTTAGLAHASVPKKMKIRPLESQGLGPIIADSQSPNKDVNTSKSALRRPKSKRRATSGM